MLKINEGKEKEKEINTAIEIISSPQNIWRILIDFKNYPKWNPFL